MYDYLIVGQGIAGSVLGYTFLKKGKKILLIDKGLKNSSSAAAAGIFNPITGKRMVKTWNASRLFPFLHQFYAQLENELGQKFFYPKTIYKPFASIEEQNYWISHSSSSDVDFVNASASSEKYQQYVKNPFGGFETKWSGYVHVKKFIQHMTEYFKAKDVYLGEEFSFSDFKVLESEIEWKGIKAKKIIFCEGFNVSDNPYFHWLPFTFTKGQILTLNLKEFPADNIINKKVFILPVGGDLFKVGSTFEWVKDTVPTEKGKNELLEKFQQVTDWPFAVAQHEAGIRAAVADRRPLIGVHPEYPLLTIFNGMGTKGVSLAPYLADQLYNFLENQSELDPAVNIKRYYALYSR
ncbi:MAG: FAD-binding oxidoreductase [Cytophagaceae bacterium]|nr:FAD-binding oxidoreductase [Cytophagaceae bacterium]